MSASRSGGSGPEALSSFTPGSAAEWRQWLELHHANSPGVWLIYWKRSSGRSTVSYGEVVDECLCFGWIDSKVQRLDELRHRQLITPRRPNSVWSAVNKRKVEALRDQGRMTAAGLAKVEAAQRDGSWNALDEVEALVVPEDLAKALEKAGRREVFEGMSRSARKVVLQALSQAKLPPTRAKRIARVVAELGEG